MIGRNSLPAARLTVLILAGGESSERDVSEVSGTAVAAALAERGIAHRLLDPAPAGRADRALLGRIADGVEAESPDVVFIVDGEGTILYVNRSLPEVPQDDVLGTSIYDYVLPDHHINVRAGNERVFASGMPGGYEVLGMSGKRSEAWYDCRVVPTKRGGKVVSATIIARDVTIRKRVEENLRKELDGTKRELADRTATLRLVSSELEKKAGTSVASDFELSRFRSVLDEAGEAIFLVDPKTGQILDANDTACRWMDCSRAALLNKTEAELRIQFPLRVPEQFRAHVSDTRDSARPQLFHGDHRRHDGSRFPVEVAITRHAFEGKQCVLAIARDAKARVQIEDALREMEDRYRALFDLSHDAIYLSHRDGSVVEVNDAAVELFGYRRTEFEGFSATKLYTDPQDILAFQQEVAENGFVRDMRVTLRKKDGRKFPGLLTATLRRAGDRKVLGYQCVIRELVRHPERTIPSTRRHLEAAEAKGHGTVLLMDENAAERDEARQILELGGMKVLIAESLAEALVIYRSRGAEIGAAVLASAPGDIANDAAFLEMRKIAPASRIVVVIPADAPEHEVVEHLAPAGLAGIVRKSIHPLALVQQVRRAVDAGEAPSPMKGTASDPVPTVKE